MKFDVCVIDPPYNFSDHLSMDLVKRGAASQYQVLSIEDIKNLPIAALSAQDCLLALWVPSSLLQEGLDCMTRWGFRQTQTHIWVKIKKNPLSSLSKQLFKIVTTNVTKPRMLYKAFRANFSSFSLDYVLNFGLGRLFRQTHEICLIGVKGSIYKHLKNHSQRSVHFAVNEKHSAKPETLQDRLDLMFPNTKKVELFARRQRPGYICLGNQAPMSEPEDIRESLEKLQSLSEAKYNQLLQLTFNPDHQLLHNIWMNDVLC